MNRNLEDNNRRVRNRLKKGLKNRLVNQFKNGLLTVKAAFIIALHLLSLQAAAQRGVFDIMAYGAVPGGDMLCTKALQSAVDACHAAGGGEVLIPAGVFKIGTIHLKSNVHLYLQQGGILRGSMNLDDYEPYTPEKPFKPLHKGLFFTEDAENISLTGEGQVDGNGDHFFEMDQAKSLDSIATRFTRQGSRFREVQSGIGDGPVVPKDRPYQMFVFSNCKKVTVKDLSITNSPFWCMHFADCDAVHVSGIRLWNNLLAPNADGIDITSCTNVIIDGCDIRAGDDALAIVGYDHHFEIPGFKHLRHISENIIISNCNLQSYSSGIRIGFLDQNTVRNIRVSNVNITHSTRGIGIFLRDEGSLENISFTNVFIETHLRTGDWWGNGEPIHISAVRGKENVELGKIRHVLFSNIICEGENGLLVYGSKESVIEDIVFDHVRFTLKDSKLNEVAGGNIDLRGCLYPQEQLFKRDIPGFLAAYVEGLRITDYSQTWEATRMPFFTHGIELTHFENVIIAGYQGNASPVNKSAHRIYAVDGKGLVTDDERGVVLKNVVR
jgi:polygalacturonase